MDNRQKNKYMALGGNHCPYCESKNIAGSGQVQTDSDCAWQVIECDDCHKRWHDIYKFVDVEAIE